MDSDQRCIAILHCKNHSAVLLCWRSAEVCALWVLLRSCWVVCCCSSSGRYAKRRGNGRPSRNKSEHRSEHRWDVCWNDKQPEREWQSPGTCRSYPWRLLQWPWLRQSSGDGRILHQRQPLGQFACWTHWISQQVCAVGTFSPLIWLQGWWWRWWWSRWPWKFLVKPADKTRKNYLKLYRMYCSIECCNAIVWVTGRVFGLWISSATSFPGEGAIGPLVEYQTRNFQVTIRVSPWDKGLVCWFGRWYVCMLENLEKSGKLRLPVRCYHSCDSHKIINVTWVLLSKVDNLPVV